MAKKTNLNTYIVFISILIFTSCNQKVKGVILEKESKMPIDSVSVSERDLRLNSYPFPWVYSDINGHFNFEKKSKDSLLFFWKPGYKSFKLKFSDSDNIDTIYMIKEN